MRYDVPHNPSMRPCFPFDNDDDLDQAAHFIKHNATDGMIDEQLKLMRRRCPQGSLCGFKSARELHELLANARAVVNLEKVNFWSSLGVSLIYNLP